jgi:uncharacterized protein YkwD
MRIRRIVPIALLVAALAVSVVEAPAAGAATSGRAKMLRLINAIRDRHNLRRLDLNRRLSRYATRHSREMAESRRLFHTSNLYSKVSRYNANTWGENVGYAKFVKRIVRLWMRSSSHRANILNRNFRKAAIGLADRGRWTYATLILYG